MKIKKIGLFGKTKAVVGMIDELLDHISEVSRRFEESITTYVDTNPAGEWAEQVEQMRKLEHEGDQLHLLIETHLYTEMLIPDSRGDVLSLLEKLNFLLGLTEDIFLAFTVEKPVIGKAFKAGFKLLVATAVQTMESAVLAARAFFRNIDDVRSHLENVGLHEEECDQISTRLKRDIFSSDLTLNEKMHLRYFVDKIDNLADEAEDAGDWLAIYAIKRAL